MLVVTAATTPIRAIHSRIAFQLNVYKPDLAILVAASMRRCALEEVVVDLPDDLTAVADGRLFRGISNPNCHHRFVFSRADVNHFHSAANQGTVNNFGFTILKSLSTTNKLPA